MREFVSHCLPVVLLKNLFRIVLMVLLKRAWQFRRSWWADGAESGSLSLIGIMDT